MKILQSDILELIRISNENPTLDFDAFAFQNKQYLNCLTYSMWEDATSSLSGNEIIKALKGFILVGKKLGWQGGSVDGAIWLYRIIEGKGLDPDHSIADWALRNSNNEYVPFGSSYSNERNIQAYFEYQESKAIRKAASYKAQKDLLSRVEGRSDRRKAAIAELRKLSTFERGKIITEILESYSNDSHIVRLEIIANDQIYPPEYYPKEWIALTSEEISALPLELRKRLYDKLSVMTKGVWKRFSIMLKESDKSI